MSQWINRTTEQWKNDRMEQWNSNNGTMEQ